MSYRGKSIQNRTCNTGKSFNFPPPPGPEIKLNPEIQHSSCGAGPPSHQAWGTLTVV